MSRRSKVSLGASIEYLNIGRVYDRIVLQPNETLIFIALLMTDEASPFPFVKPPLPPGDTYHAVDVFTGLDTPYTIPKGYTWAVLGYWWSFDQRVEGKMYYDGFHAESLYEEAYRTHYEHTIMPDYNMADPTGASAHTIDYTFTNLGSSDMKGYFWVTGKLIMVGTEKPETKKVKCKHCGHEHIVDRRATWVTCPKCGLKTLYYPILFGDEVSR